MRRLLADLSDVEQALVSATFAALHPEGDVSHTVLGSTIRVYRGWPPPSALNADLANGVVNVSVFSIADDTRDTTRWGLCENVSPGISTLTVAAADGSVFIGGMPAVGQLVGVVVNNNGFSYRVQKGDSVTSIAAKLAGLVRASYPCTQNGAVLTIPNAGKLIARAVADATVQTEWARQEQGFRISVWAPSPSARDVVCRAVACCFAQIAFLDLADGSAGRLRYRKTSADDDDQSAKLYRRDLIYSVEYGTTVTSGSPSVLFGDVVVDGASSLG